MRWEPIKNQQLKYYCFEVAINDRNFVAFSSDKSGAKLKEEFPQAKVTLLGTINNNDD